MSRRQSEETTGRLRPGKPPDGSHIGLSATHVRGTVCFLNPDTTGANLERAPSLNRLHAQSSTETSGLGETITSGFSSQESVLSYIGDDRERSYVDRSRRKPEVSPAYAVVEHELLNAYRGSNVHLGSSEQLISKQQRQHKSHLSIQQPGQRFDYRDRKIYLEDYENSKNVDFRISESQQTGRRQKSSRDTGGRSLTPQQAREEYQDRQRRLQQIQKERDSSVYKNTPTQDKGKQDTVRCLEKQTRPTSGPWQSDSPENSNLQERSSVVSSTLGRRKVIHSNDSRDSGDAEARAGEHRRNSRGDRSDRGSITSVRTSKPTNKEAGGNRSSFRSQTRTASKDSIDAQATSVTRSGSKDSIDRSDVATNNRRRKSSELSPKEQERSSSISREQLKSQSSSSRTNSDEYNDSSSSRKSYETQIFNIKSQNSRSASNGEFLAGSSKNQSKETSNPRLSDLAPESDKEKHQRYSSSTEVKRNSRTLSDAKTESGNILTRTLGEEKSNKEQFRDVNVSSKGSSDRASTRTESRRGYSRQRSEPLEKTRDARDTREYERSKSWDVEKVNQSSEKRYERDLERRRSDQVHIDYSESRRDDFRKDTHRSKDSNTQIRFSDSRDIDLGPVIIKRQATSSNDSAGDRAREKRTRDGFSREHGRGQNVDSPEKSNSSDRSRGQTNFGSSFKRQLPSGRSYDLGREDIGPDRNRESESEKLPTRDVENARSEREEKDRRMNYERLFHEASRGMNGTGGGGGSRGYPPTLDEDYSTSSTRRPNGGQSYNNMSRSSQHTVDPATSQAGAARTSRSEIPVSQNTSASYSKIQTPLSPIGPIPIVQLTSPDDPQTNIETIDREWKRRGSRSSNGSKNSRRSSTGSGRFLGINTGSAWAKWSRERRASYRRRIEKMEQTEDKTATDITKVSTPIKKARQEGLKFIHPDLEARYLSEDDLNELRRHKQQQVQAMRVIEKRGRHKYRKNEVKMTPEEWHMLQEFWNHNVFVRARFIGIFLSLIALVFILISIANNSWLKHSAWNLTIVEGLWVNCTQTSGTQQSSQECSSSSGRSWQNGAIGLLIFAAIFGFLASALSICGVFTSPLARKIYYFHSAGEIFFICALSATVALIIFVIAVESDSSLQSHQYGIGYGLGWTGTFFFLAAAVCLSLDDLVRESSRAKWCRWCWRSKTSDRNELRQV